MRRIRLLPFGGLLLKKSNAKSARVLCAISWTRVVLESRCCNFEKDERKDIAQQLLKGFAKKSRLVIADITIHGNQLHFNVKLRRKRNFAPFIRAATGALALKFSESSKNNPLKESFWACRPWTCVIEKLKALFGRQSLRSFYLDFELAELLRARHSEGLLLLGP